MSFTQLDKSKFIRVDNQLKVLVIFLCDNFQITEMFKLYSGLGGNGQAEEYYERVLALPLRERK